MKSLVVSFTIIGFLCTQVNAGFWSNAFSTALGNTMSGNGGSNNYYDKDATVEPKKIQQTLLKLGFYNGISKLLRYRRKWYFRSNPKTRSPLYA